MATVKIDFSADDDLASILVQTEENGEVTHENILSGDSELELELDENSSFRIVPVADVFEEDEDEADETDEVPEE